MKFEPLNEGVRKWEFSKKDLDEIKEIMIDDPDFMECYISSPSTKQTYDENLDDFIYNFI